MGRYMRKTKIAGEVAVMEVSHQTSLGVRTRARTLALQRLQRPSSPTPAAQSPAADPGDGSYLQLRSRRLEKPPLTAARPKEAGRDGPKPGHGFKNASDHAAPKTRPAACSSSDSLSAGSAAVAEDCSRRGGREVPEPASRVLPDDGGVEASFGENIPDFELGDRNTRETTPCSLIRDPDDVGTPGSTTRPTTNSRRRTQSLTHRGILPTTSEMDEFFAGSEQLQQKIFTEKYNFDPVNDCPLPGRYEWTRLDA